MIVQVGSTMWVNPEQVQVVEDAFRGDEYKTTILMIDGSEVVSDWEPGRVAAMIAGFAVLGDTAVSDGVAESGMCTKSPPGWMGYHSFNDKGVCMWCNNEFLDR